MSFDRIAPFYRWLEHALFGRALQRCRTAHLPLPSEVSELLTVGDGDGRFLAAALQAHPALRAVAIDASASMQRLAKERSTFAKGRVRFIRADILNDDVAAQTSHAVATHFFFDCFAEPELRTAISTIAAAAPDARYWLVSEFAIPEAGPSRWMAYALTKALYAFFRRTTGISGDKLVDYGPFLERQGFHLQREVNQLGGLLVGQIWARKDMDKRLSTTSERGRLEDIAAP